MTVKDKAREMLSVYKYRIELHAHTNPCSLCSKVSPRELVRRYKALGYDALNITNHFNPESQAFSSAKDFAEFYLTPYHEAKDEGEKLGVTVYLGAEVRFNENMNDYLVFGLDEKDIERIYPYIPLGLESFCGEFRRDGILIIQAHRFRDGMTAVDKKYLDGVETFNMHWSHNSRVAVAQRFADENPELIYTIGSDFHDPGYEGLGCIYSQYLPKDQHELCSLIKSRDFVMGIADRLII